MGWEWEMVEVAKGQRGYGGSWRKENSIQPKGLFAKVR